MKHSKKLLSLLITASMAISLIPATVMADTAKTPQTRIAAVSSIAKQTKDVTRFTTLEDAASYVREKMVALQQSLAVTEDVVMDGRDIASCVLPNAQVKIYLDASVEVRAKRRYLELIEKGKEADLKTVEDEVRERDYRDMHRENSPLVRVSEAILVDSSYVTIDEVVEEIVSKVKNYDNE